MSRKSCWIAIAVVLMASCAYGQLNQNWSFGLANGVSQTGGVGITTADTSVTVGETHRCLPGVAVWFRLQALVRVK